MKNFLRTLAVLFCSTLFASAALPPVVRNAWSTNLPGATISATNNVRLYPPSYNNVPLIVYDNTVVASLVVNSNGNIGIGEVNPLFALEISDANGQIRLNGTNAASWIIGHMAAPVNSKYIELRSKDSRGALSSLTDIGAYNKEGIITWDNTNGNVWMLGQVSGLVGTNGSNYVTLTQLQNSNFVLMLNGSSTNQKLFTPILSSPTESNTVMYPNAYNANPLTVNNNAGALSFGVGSNGVVYCSQGFLPTNAVASITVGEMAGSNNIGRANTYVGVVAGLDGTGTSNAVIVGFSAGRTVVNAEKAVLIGQYAGLSGSTIYDSVFTGTQAGYQALNCYDSVYSGYLAGFQASGCYESVYSGYLAGSAATNSFQSVIIGNEAGQTAKTSQSVTLIGHEAGKTILNSPFTVYVGQQAGLASSSGGYSVGIGTLAGGSCAVGSSNNVSIGWQAGYNTAAANGANVFIGSSAGYQATSARGIWIGTDAGYTENSSSNGVFIGYQAGYGAVRSIQGAVMGYQAGYGSRDTLWMVAIGSSTGLRATNCNYMTAIGPGAAYEAKNCTNGVFIGQDAGLRALGATNSIFIGPSAGTNNVRPNTLLIDGAYQGTNALIYGEFDNKRVRINGVFEVTNGLFVNAFSNGVAPPTVVKQPIGLFAALTCNITNSFTANAVYTPLTNYNGVITNGFTARAGWAGGFLTNQTAGFYRVDFYATMLPGNSEILELELFFDETGHEETAVYGHFDTVARVRTLTSSGIHWLPASTGVSVRVKNSAASAIAVWRAGLSIGTP